MKGQGGRDAVCWWSRPRGCCEPNQLPPRGKAGSLPVVQENRLPRLETRRIRSFGKTAGGVAERVSLLRPRLTQAGGAPPLFIPGRAVVSARLVLPRWSPAVLPSLIGPSAIDA